MYDEHESAWNAGWSLIGVGLAAAAAAAIIFILDYGVDRFSSGPSGEVSSAPREDDEEGLSPEPADPSL